MTSSQTWWVWSTHHVFTTSRSLTAGSEVMKRTESLRDSGANDRFRDAEMGCPCKRPQRGKGVEQSSTEDGVNVKCPGCRAKFKRVYHQWCFATINLYENHPQAPLDNLISGLGIIIICPAGGFGRLDTDALGCGCWGCLNSWSCCGKLLKSFRDYVVSLQKLLYCPRLLLEWKLFSEYAQIANCSWLMVSNIVCSYSFPGTGWPFSGMPQASQGFWDHFSVSPQSFCQKRERGRETGTADTVVSHSFAAVTMPPPWPPPNAATWR